MAAAAPTMTVTSSFDHRDDKAYGTQYPGWEYVLNGLWDADDTADGTHSIQINGILKKVIFTVPDNANNVTGQCLIRDNGDNTIFNSQEKAENATYAYDVDEVLTGTTDILVGISAASGTAATNLVVTLRGV